MPCYVASPSVVTSDIDNGLALLDLDKNVYFSLNQTGATIWRAIARPVSIDAICAVLAEAYQTTPYTCRPDVERLISRLVEARLAHEVDQPTS